MTVIDGGTFVPTPITVDGLLGGWGLSVDGSDQIWVVSNNNDKLRDPSQGNIPAVIFVLDGTNHNAGNLIGSFSNPALSIVTAVQIDQSGNVWAVDNWNLESAPGDIRGGDGLVEFIGLATPVKTPLVGPPEVPNGSSDDLIAAATPT